MNATIQPDELARFCEMLQAMLSPDADARQESERMYEATKQSHPDQLCRCLIAVVADAPDETLRQQGAVLLRQCCKSTRRDFVWPRLSSCTQALVTTALLNALRAEQSQRIRHQIGDVIAEIACFVLDPTAMSPGQVSGWPELQGTLEELLSGSNQDHRASSLRIMKDILNINPSVAQTFIVRDSVFHTLRTSHEVASPQVRLQAVLLFMALFDNLPQKVWQPFCELMPHMLTIVMRMENDPGAFEECLQAFVQVATVAPSAFLEPQAHLHAVVQMMITICRAKDSMPDSVRCMAFEFLVSLSEKKGKLCSKYPSFVGEVVRTCMEFMLEVEDEDNWAEAETSETVADISLYDVGRENIDRFAKAIGAEKVMDPVIAGVREYVKGESWKYRYVAIMTLSQCVETVEKHDHVDEIVLLLEGLLQDAHPRVRYAALHAIGQTSTDHAPYVQEELHERILPALSRLMDDPVPRVGAHACAAFVNFAEELYREILLPYVPGLMEKLKQKMMASSRIQREQAITAVAVIAGVVEVEFVQHYHHIMPALKQIIMSATQEDERALRGKAFECMSLLGMAVGRDVFKDDAKDAMQAMLSVASNGFEADDPQKSYIHEAAQRICRALREDFLPYLSYLLPGILSALQMQPTEVVDPDTVDPKDMTLDILQDGSAVGLRTSQIEDFRSAVQLLSCFLEVLGGHYFDYVRETARCLVPALSFRFDDEVKREAINAWQELICVAKSGLEMRQVADDGLIAELLRAYLQSTANAMQVEPNIELLQVQAIGAADCIRAAGAGTMNLAEMDTFCGQIQKLIWASTQRRLESEATNAGDEDEEAEKEETCRNEQMLSVKLADLLGSMMDIHKSEFLQAGLPHVMSIIRDFLVSDKTASERYIALYLADEILDMLEAEGSCVWPVFMEQLIHGIKDEDIWVRQAAAHGVLHASRTEAFGAFAERAAASIAEVVSNPAVHQDDNRWATEVAVAALGNLCRWQRVHLSATLKVYLRVFLDALPLRDDLDQAGPTHELLMNFVPEILSEYPDRKVQILKVFLDVYDGDRSTVILNDKIRNTFLGLGQSDVVQLQSVLTDRQRKQLQKLLKAGQPTRRKPKKQSR